MPRTLRLMRQSCLNWSIAVLRASASRAASAAAHDRLRVGERVAS